MGEQSFLLEDPPALGSGFLTLDEAFPPPPDEAPPPVAPRPQHPAVLVLTPNEERRLMVQVQQHYDEAISGREEFETRRALRLRRYLGDVSLRDHMQPWEDAPQLFLPLTRTTTETLVGKSHKGLLATPDTIEVKGVGEEDMQRAYRRQAFYRWQLFDLNNFAVTLKEVLMDAALDSLGILKVYRYAQPTQMPEGMALLQTIVKYESTDLGTMLIPPDARGTQYPEARYMGQQLYIVPDDEFPLLRTRGFTVPTIEPGRALAEVYTPSERDELTLERDSIHPDAWYENTVELVELYERFTRDSGERVGIVVHWFPKLLVDDGGKASPHLARVALLKDVLPQQVFPREMWPYFAFTFWGQPRQLRGMNVPDRLESYQDALNRLAEQMLHLGDITILPLVFANVALTGDLPDNIFKLQPGAIVPLDNLGPGGLQIHNPQSANRHFIEEMQVFRGFAEEDSNVTAYSQGRNATQPNTPRTLGGLALLLQAGNEAQSTQTKEQALALSQALKFGYALWQSQPVDGLTFPAPQGQALEARLFGEAPDAPPPSDAAGIPAVTMEPEDLHGLFDVRVNVNPDAHLEQQKYLTLAERLDAILAPVWPEGRRLLWKHVWERLGLAEFDRFYPEQVAKQQTMLQTLAIETQLARFEMLLLQLEGPERGAASIQRAEQVAASTSQDTVSTPAQSPSDFRDIIELLKNASGVNGGNALAQQQVPETPNSAFAPTTRSF